MRIWGFLVAGLVSVATAVQASVLANWSLDEVVRHADSVVVAVVSSSRVVPAQGSLVTETTFAVRETLYGPVSTTLVVTQPGGELGGIAVDVAGAVRWVVGQEVILITQAVPHGRRVVVGLSLGAYQRTQQRWTQSIDVPLASPGGPIMAPPGHRSITLAELQAAIRRQHP